MNKSFLLLIILLLPFASAQTLFDYQSLDLDININNFMEIVPSSSNYYVTDASIGFYWFPLIDYRQQVSSLETLPDSEFNDGFLEFSFSRPKNLILDILIQSTLTTSSNYKQVKNKIDFPITSLDSEFTPFLVAGKIIDINKDIKALANSLSEGKDDLFEVVFSFADWVQNNINYNLSTLTAEASKKSSWVLINRVGVCDELTSLFISLNRAVGIPAKFISGISYTDLDIFDNPWGPHGWAEVYFPEVGWVPFDVTYKQFGWVDATHIKLKESADAAESSVLYNAFGKGFSISGGELVSDVEVLNKGNLKQSHITLGISAEKTTVGFGSHNLVVVEIENLENYYISDRLQLAKTSDIENLDSIKRIFFLKPFEKKKEFFIIKIEDDLKKGYSYTFPIAAYVGNQSAKTSFSSSNRETVYDYNVFKSLIPTIENVKAPISISCLSNKELFFVGDLITISCEVTNKELNLIKADICLDDECHDVKLNNEAATIEFTKEAKELGVKNLAISASNDDFETTSYALINVVDAPNASIEIEAPETVSFNDVPSIHFSVLKESFSSPEEVEVIFDGGYLSQNWILEEFADRQSFSLSLPARYMREGLNDFNIIVNYKDERNKEYEVKKNFQIELINVTFTQKILLFFNHLNLRLNSFIDNLL